MLNNFPWIWWGIDASLLLNVERKDDDLRHLVAASWSDLGKGSEIIYISSALGAPQDPSMRRSCWIQGCLILVSYGMQGNPDNSPAQYLRLKTSTDICNADFITNLTNSLNLVLKGNGNRQGFGPKHSVVMFWINHSHRLPLQWKHTLSPTLSGGLTRSSWQCWGGGGTRVRFIWCFLLQSLAPGNAQKTTNTNELWIIVISCDICICTFILYIIKGGQVLNTKTCWSFVAFQRAESLTGWNSSANLVFSSLFIRQCKAVKFASTKKWCMLVFGA